MSWIEKSLADAPIEIIDGDRGKNYPAQNELLDEGYCLFLSATNVTKDGFVFEKCQFITEQKDNALRKGRVRRNDVVLTTRGTLGNVAYYSDNIPFDHVRINSGMVTIKTTQDELSPRYLYYYLKSDPFQTQVRALQSGAAQPQLPIRDIKKIKISYPDTTTQDRISKVIGAYDDLIENNRRRIVLLEEAARLLYREWFVHFRFPGHEHVKIVDGVPKGWEQKAIGEIARVYRGKSYKSSELREEDGKAFANLKCIQRYGGFRTSGLKRFEGDHKEHHTLRPGDIVMAVTDMTREAMIIAQAGRIPASVNEDAIYSMDLVKIVPHERIPSNWLYSLFRHSGFSFDVREHASGTNVLHLKPKHIENWMSPIPPHLLMQGFVSIIDPMINQQDRLELQIHHLEKARNLLLPRLMDGRLEV